MSDQTDSQVANEDTNASQAAVSQEASGETQKGNSLAGAALADLALKDPEAYETLRRTFQSEKDKSVAELRKRLDEIEGKANSQPDAGVQKVEEVKPKQVVDIEVYKRAYPDIKLDDPDVLPRIAGMVNDPGKMLLELDKIKQERAGKPRPNASSVTPPAGSTQALASVESLRQEYETLLSDPRSIADPKKKARRKELIKLMEEKENT